MSPAPSRRLLPALAASVAVHGLLWLLVDGLPRAPRPPVPPARPATLQWVEVTSVAPERARRDGPMPRSGSDTKPSAPRPSGEARADASPGPSKPPPGSPVADKDSAASTAKEHKPSPEDASAPPEPALEAPPSREEAAPSGAPRAGPRPPDSPLAMADTSAVTERARVSDLPRATPGLAEDVPRAVSSAVLTDFARAPEAVARAPDTARLTESPGSGLLLATRTQALPMRRADTTPAPDVGIRDARKSPTAQALVEDLVSESVGRGRVDRGLVHPYFSQLGKKLVAVWDADRSVKEHGLQGYFDMGMERSRAYGRAWSERAANYGSSGAFVANNQPLDDKRRPVSTVGDPALRMRSELREKMREGFRSTRRALIRVVQDNHGRLLDVVLVQPSHQPEVDQEAVKDVRAAAEKLPPPPAEAVGSRERLVSLWEFELIISISPPIPTFTFEFDEALGFIDTRLPLDKRIYKRVRLVELR
ncbi:TonB C-terminal domain-containing protein [Myxococcus eversor]|uniref:TonB C-terminal domain-containing protein n=1 Tax=Myxococcus eversor TaxID=2709661 RepID=UPI0013D7ED0E|nr:TonB C-terminal domain-containing protein [Myxococcus eversor]